jgi:hypothetical protein
MSAAIFPYVFLRDGFVERLAYSTALAEQSGGRRVAQKLHAAGELVVSGSLLFPNDGGSWASLRAFFDARFGGFDPFLYKAQDKDAAAVLDSFTAVTSQVDFEATRRYVNTATVVVRKNGVEQTLTTDYTLKNESGGAYVLGTSTKLVVRFNSAPGNGVAVTVAYDFYYPMRFEMDELDAQDLIGGGVGGGSIANRTLVIRMRETGPGFSYAAAPNSL